MGDLEPGLMADLTPGPTPDRSFDLIIFDNDGVLVDSETLSNQVLSRLLTLHGLPTTFEESVATYLGRSMPSVLAVAEAKLGRPIPEDIIGQYIDELYAMFETELTSVRGIEQVLGVLEGAGLRKCVASSGSPRRISLTLVVTGLAGYFGSDVFSASEVEHGKPAPDLFLHAARQMGVEPDRCAVIEDSPLGIEGGNAAGMTTFGYAAMTPAERLSEASGGVFSDMHDLPRLLGLDRATNDSAVTGLA